MPVISCVTKPSITSTSVIIDLIISFLSVIVFELSRFAICAIFSGVAFRLFLNIKVRTATTTIKINAIIPVSSFTKSIKLKPAFAPIMILGGSPIRVAVPPIFEASTSVIKNGTGSVSNSFAITKVTGIISTTVVTLSKNADATAVNAASTNKTNFGCPFVHFKSSTAIHLNTPLRLEICTIIIIPIRRKITSNDT